MVFRHLASSLLLAALLPAQALMAGAPLATHPSLTFFSSISEEPIARLEAESIGPRFVKHGPFQMPAPGVAIESPSLTLHDQPCTADDWARVLRELDGFQQVPGGIRLLITLPDGRSFLFQRPPAVSSAALSGLVRPLNPETGEPDGDRLLRITHDGQERLRADFRALTGIGARRVHRQAVEPGPDPAEPLPSVPPDSYEPVASP